MKKPLSLFGPLASVLSALFFTAYAVDGQTVTVSFTGIDQIIPDGSPGGWSDRRTLAVDFAVVESVTVSLEITGGFNGDLYAQLTHDTGFSVLLNRVGRSADTPTGYLDSGLNVQFDDSPSAAGDIHQYRLTLSGTETTPVGGLLTGTWSPDGRSIDPNLVLDTSSRTARLDSFIGLNPNGEWKLFIADLDTGGVSTVRSWGMTVQGVPEPGATGLIVAAVCLMLGTARLRSRDQSDLTVNADPPELDGDRARRSTEFLTEH